LDCGFSTRDINNIHPFGVSGTRQTTGARGNRRWKGWHGPQYESIWWGDMLVLTRKIGESIHIGEDIEIFVTAIEQNKVKLGIRSPRHVPVYRKELYLKMKSDNKEAAQMETHDFEKMLEFFPAEGGTVHDRKLGGES